MNCVIETCDREVNKAGRRCTGHESRWRRGVRSPEMELPLRSKGRRGLNDCSVDNCYNPVWCRTWCKKHYARWLRVGDTDSRPTPTVPTRLRMYGLDEDRYRALLVAQGHACAICERAFSNEVRPCIDHDHACCPDTLSCGQCVRGILCGNCNKGIGMLREDARVFANAMKYLKFETHICLQAYAHEARKS